MVPPFVSTDTEHSLMELFYNHCWLSFDDYLFNDLDFPVCRWHAEILGREDNTTEQVLTLINNF